MEEFCAEIGQTECHAKTVDKNLKEVKKLKTVKFAVDTMETNDARMKNKLKDSRICNAQEQVEGFKSCKDQERVEGCKIADGCILWIEFSKMVESGEWTTCGIRRDR